MSLFRSKPRERYYLLPGQGGRMARKKGIWAMKIALSIGVTVAFLVGFVIWLLNRPSGSSGLFSSP